METLPQVSELVAVAGIEFPLTIEAYSQATRTASLKGEHPENGMEVLLPRVCLDLLHAPQVAVPATVLAIGQYARLKSGGPLMTIAEVLPPLPGMPEGAATIAVCLQFRSNNELLKLELDVRALHISDSRHAI